MIAGAKRYGNPNEEIVTSEFVVVDGDGTGWFDNHEEIQNVINIVKGNKKRY